MANCKLLLINSLYLSRWEKGFHHPNTFMLLYKDDSRWVYLPKVDKSIFEVMMPSVLCVVDESRTWCLWKTHQPTGRDYPKEKSSNWWWSTPNKWTNTGLNEPLPADHPLYGVLIVKSYFSLSLSHPLISTIAKTYYLLQPTLPGNTKTFFCESIKMASIQRWEVLYKPDHPQNYWLMMSCLLFQGNMQRCKLVMDQISEARDSMLKVLDHKDRVLKLLNKNGTVKKVSKLKRKEKV